jgi:hypothetical protein
LLADPEFSKLTELTAGLDFAFPAANKIGEGSWYLGQVPVLHLKCTAMSFGPFHDALHALCVATLGSCLRALANC